MQVAFALVFAIFAVKTTLPSFTTQTEILAGALGGIHTFDHNFVPLLVTALFGLSAVTFILKARTFAITVAVATGSLLLGLLFLLFLRRGQDGWWAYYQLKYEWFVIIFCSFLLVFAVVKILAITSTREWKISFSWAVLLAALIAVISILPSGSPKHAVLCNFVAQSLVRDHPRLEADGIYLSFARLYSTTNPAILWDSQLDDEFFVDFWLMQMSAENIADPIRGLAYSRNLDDMKELCNVVKELGANVTVVTTKLDLKPNLLEACPAGSDTKFVSP